MKTKNHSEHSLLELAVDKAANEEGFTPGAARDVVSGRKQAWSPHEVWRTRVKAPAPRARTEPG